MPITKSTSTTHKLAPLVLLYLCSLLSGCNNNLAPSHSIEVASKGLHSAAFSPDGQFALAGSIYHGGSLWRVGDAERLYNWNHKNGEFTTLIATAFSNNGKWALTADVHTLVLWDTQNGGALRYWIAPGEILDIALSPNGNLALLGLSDHTAVIFDIRKGGIKRTFHHQNRVRSVDFSGDGRLALTGSEDYSATLWDVASGQQIYSFRHQDQVQLVKLSHDGSRALTASKYDKAVVWNTQTGQMFGEIPLGAQRLKRGTRFTTAQFSADNELLLTGLPDQTVQLWELATLSQLYQWELPKRDSWKPTSAAVLAVSFTATPGEFIAAASNGFIHQLKIQTTK